jgi:hypothetical protein
MHGKNRRKKPLERPRRRWKDNIELNIRETECGGTYWIHLVQYKDQWKVLVITIKTFEFRKIYDILM